MNTTLLEFTANEQELIKTDGLDEFASNTVAYIEAHFALGDNWNGFDAVRAVWSSYYGEISTVLDASYKCKVPTEILLHRSKVYVNLVGSIAEDDVLTDRLTSFPIKALTVTADARVETTETAPITPSQFEQFVETVHDDAQAIINTTQDSEAWAVGTRGGVPVTSDDPAYENNAKYYAEQADPGTGGLTEAMKVALLQIADKVAYSDANGTSYYNDLYNSFYPPADLVSISAAYTQGGTVYDTDSLDSLRDDLVVTATYSDSTTATITTYTLSGSLTQGTSTITASYGGQTDTFTVTVTHAEPVIEYLYNWDFTQSLVDSVNGQTAELLSGGTLPEQSSSGVVFDAATQRIYLGQIPIKGKTVELDIAEFDFKGNASYHIRLFNAPAATTSTSPGIGVLVYKSGEGWASYGYASQGQTSTSATKTWSANYNDSLGINAFDGTTVKIVSGTDGHTRSLYVDDVLMGTVDTVYFDYDNNNRQLFIGGMNSSKQSSGDQCYNMTITGVRIYENL